MGQNELKGAFGETLARYYHQSESKTAATSWPEQSTFAITRLHSEVGLPDVSQPIPEEAAIHVSIAIKPVPIRSYTLYIDDGRIEVPFIPPYRTSIIDLESHPICTVDCGFDYVHYHVPREGLDEIARDHKVKPVDFKPDRKYPVAFLIHGGPQGSFGNAWSWRWNPQAFAGAGYAVVMIDFHGSTGYGQTFERGIQNNWGVMDFQDVMAGVVELVDEVQVEATFPDGRKLVTLHQPIT